MKLSVLDELTSAFALGQCENAYGGIMGWVAFGWGFILLTQDLGLKNGLRQIGRLRSSLLLACDTRANEPLRRECWEREGRGKERFRFTLVRIWCRTGTWCYIILMVENFLSPLVIISPQNEKFLLRGDVS